MNALHRLFTPAQPRMPLGGLVLSTVAVVVAVALLGGLGELSGHPFFMASLGATCVLLFTLPAAPLSQPLNIVGGYVLSTTVAVLLFSFLSSEWWSLALATGAAAMLMTGLRILHPPAAAMPMLVTAGGESWHYLLEPVFVGAVVVAVLGILYRRVVGDRLWER
ncbi:HPP family protein [Corynebacterium sp.]|uniref:HPP family protein n=1 Tax=Corynebacterium sp. TaxID=1720 RepID=UPI003B3AF8CC